MNGERVAASSRVLVPSPVAAFLRAISCPSWLCGVTPLGPPLGIVSRVRESIAARRFASGAPMARIRL